MLVFVLSKNGKPLMPCSEGKARRLLKEEKAKVKSREPFTIKLLHGSSGYKQKIKLKVDAGANHIGAAAVREDGQVLYASETDTRKDISDKMTQRRSYRRTRRGRKLRYRKPRFDNRVRKDGWLTPTVRSKIQAHEAEINFIKKHLPVSEIIIETAAFDIHRLSNPNVTSYQNGQKKGFHNEKAFVLVRDSHTCQDCKGKKKDKILHIHHIQFRSNGGSNVVSNLITLCKTCHDSLHAKKDAQKESLKKFKASNTINTKGATQVSTICAYLRKTLAFTEAYGFETKLNRERLGLPKTHYMDAICVGLKPNETVTLPDVYFKKVRIARRDYQKTRGRHSEEKIPTGKIKGIRKFDKVQWKGGSYFIKGRMSTGYAILMDISGKKIEFKPIPKLELMKRLTARKSCLTSRMTIESSQSNSTSSSSSNTEKDFSKEMVLGSL